MMPPKRAEDGCDGELPALEVSPCRRRVALYYRRPVARPLAPSAAELVCGVVVNRENRSLPGHCVERIELIAIRGPDAEVLRTFEGERMLPVGFSPCGRWFAYLVASQVETTVRVVEAEGGAVVQERCQEPVNAVTMLLGVPAAMWVPQSHRLAYFTPGLGRQSRAGTSHDVIAVEVDGRPGEGAEGGRPRRPWSQFETALVEEYLLSQLVLLEVGTGRERRCGVPIVPRSISPSPDGSRWLVTHYGDIRKQDGPDYADELWAVDGQPRCTSVRHTVEPVVVNKKIVGSLGTRWHPLQPATAVVVTRDDDGAMALLDIVVSDTMTLTRTLPLPGICEEFCWLSDGAVLCLCVDMPSDRATLWLVSPQSEVAPRALAVHKRSAYPFGRPRWNLDAATVPGEVRPMWTKAGPHEVMLPGYYEHCHVGRVGISDDRRVICSMSHEAGGSAIAEVSRTDGTVRVLRVPAGGHYERALTALDDDCRRFLVTCESRCEPPYWMVVSDDDRSAIRLSGKEGAGATSQIDRVSVRARPRRRQAEFQMWLTSQPGRSASLPGPGMFWIYPQVAGRVAPLHQPLASTQYLRLRRTPVVRLALENYVVVSTPPLPVRTTHVSSRELAEVILGVLLPMIQCLVEEGVVDRDRIALGGHCRGADATVAVLTDPRAAGTFRAGVAYAGSYSQVLGDDCRCAGEHERSPGVRVVPLTAPLLLIHGGRDMVSPVAAVQTLFERCRAGAMPVRLVSLPLEEHVAVSEAGFSSIEREIKGWCDRNLACRTPF